MYDWPTPYKYQTEYEFETEEDVWSETRNAWILDALIEAQSDDLQADSAEYMWKPAG